MKNLSNLIVAGVLASLLVGCSGGSSEDDKLGTQAAPPSPGAVASPMKLDKKRPGNMSMAGAPPGGASANHLRAKPAGQ